MRKYGVLSLLYLLVACHGKEPRSVQVERLVAQELAGIDWNEVDQFPLFGNCDETASKLQQKQCFEQTFLEHYVAALNVFEYVLQSDVTDTIDVDFCVDELGQIHLNSITQNLTIQKELPEFNGILTRCLYEVPNMQPAIKRGIPVSSKYRIPILVNTKSN